MCVLEKFYVWGESVKGTEQPRYGINSVNGTERLWYGVLRCGINSVSGKEFGSGYGFGELCGTATVQNEFR